MISLDGEDFRQKPFSERKAVLGKVLRRTRRGIQYVEHTEDDGGEMFKAVCKLGLEGSSQRSSMRLIALVRQKPGSKSKNRRRTLQLGLSMEPSRKGPSDGPPDPNSRDGTVESKDRRSH
jgi:hypothetical protein